MLDQMKVACSSTRSPCALGGLLHFAYLEMGALEPVDAQGRRAGKPSESGSWRVGNAEEG